MPPASPSADAASREGAFSRGAWWLLHVYTILYFTRLHYTLGLGIPNLLFLIALAMGGCWVLSILVEGQRPRLHVRQLRWMLLLLGLMAFSTLFARVTFYGYYATRYMLQYILLIPLVASTYMHSAERLRALLRTFAIGVAILSVQGVEFYVLPGGGRWRGGFAGHFVGDPNDFALFMNSCSPILFYFAFTSRTGLGRGLWFTLALCAVFSAVYTFSRGGFITLVAMGCFLFMQASGARGKLLAGGALFTAVLLALLPESYWESLRQIAPAERTRDGLEFEDSSVRGRYIAWQAGLKMAGDRPLTGVGPGNFESAMWGSYLEPGQRKASSAHSMYIQLLGEMGLPAVLWVAGFIWLNFRVARRTQRFTEERGDRDGRLLAFLLSVGFFGYLIGAAFLSVLYYPTLYWLAWFIGTHADVVTEHAPAPLPAAQSPRLKMGLVQS